MSVPKAKKKRLSLCIAILMIFSLLSSTAYAEGAVVHVTDAAGLQAAILAAAEPTTIILDNSMATGSTMTIPAGKQITLSANAAAGITLSAAGASLTKLIEVAAGAKITLDGNITYDCANLQSGNMNAGAIFTMNGIIILNSGTVKNYHSTTAISGAITARGAQGYFEMNGGSVQNNQFTNQYCGAVLVTEGAAFTMNGGKISLNESTDINSGGGVMVYTVNDGAVLSSAWKGMFTMNNGEISGNKAQTGGGVFLYGASPYANDFSSRSSFEMNGGVISGNISTDTDQGGGGVFVLFGGEFVLNNGAITNNTAAGAGGGVATYDCYVTFYGKTPTYGVDTANWHKWFPASFTMNGGTISLNKATSQSGVGDQGCGGGVYVASNHVTLNGGEIINNEARKQGGGVYVGSVPYKLTMYNALITDNSAENGGGLWFCPTGTAEFYVTNGSAIFNNTATVKGDDFSSEKKDASYTYSFTLPERMLGGGKVDWYIDEAGNRFVDEISSAKLTAIEASTDAADLKSVALESAKQLAKPNAKLTIINNTAGTYGGGVGSNGSIQIGEKSPDEKTLEVLKVWKNTEVAPGSVTVRLVIDGQKLDSVDLDNNNGWKGAFSHLPANIDMGKVSVIEDSVSGFTATYSKPEAGSVANTFVIKVTNTPAKTDGYDLPQSGDSFHTKLWFTLAGLSLIVLAALMINNRRKKAAPGSAD